MAKVNLNRMESVEDLCHLLIDNAFAIHKQQELVFQVEIHHYEFESLYGTLFRSSFDQ